MLDGLSVSAVKGIAAAILFVSAALGGLLPFFLKARHKAPPTDAVHSHGSGGGAKCPPASAAGSSNPPLLLPRSILVSSASDSSGVPQPASEGRKSGGAGFKSASFRERHPDAIRPDRAARGKHSHGAHGRNGYGAVASATPPRHHTFDVDRFLSLGNCLGAGIFLGGGLCHLLAESHSSLSSIQDTWPGFTSSFPLASFLAGVGFFTILLVEEATIAITSQRRDKKDRAAAKIVESEKALAKQKEKRFSLPPDSESNRLQFSPPPSHSHSSPQKHSHFLSSSAPGPGSGVAVVPCPPDCELNERNQAKLKVQRNLSKNIVQGLTPRLVLAVPRGGTRSQPHSSEARSSGGFFLAANEGDSSDLSSDDVADDQPGPIQSFLDAAVDSPSPFPSLADGRSARVRYPRRHAAAAATVEMSSGSETEKAPVESSSSYSASSRALSSSAGNQSALRNALEPTAPSTPSVTPRIAALSAPLLQVHSPSPSPPAEQLPSFPSYSNSAPLEKRNSSSKRSSRKDHAHHSHSDDSKADDHDHSHGSAHGHGHGGAHEGHSHISIAPDTSYVVAYLLVLALSFHSIFEGISLGTQKDIGRTLSLFVVILAHAPLAGFALGVSLVKAKARKCMALSCLFLFCIMTPIGAMLGLILSVVLEGERLALVSALFQAFSAGTFLFVALEEIIPKELAVPKDKGWKLLLILVGFLAMASIKVFDTD